MKTVEEVENLIEQIEELKTMALPIARQLLELQTGRDHGIDEEDISVEYGSIYINYTTFCCGDSDDHQERLPIEYLFDTEWQEHAKAEIQRKKEEAAERERIRKEKAKQAAAERERKQYLELKAKYEGGAA